MSSDNQDAPRKTIEISDLRSELFEGFVGETVDVAIEEGTFPARLVEIQTIGGPLPGIRERESFALIFMTDFRPPHGLSIIVTLSHPRFGAVEGLSMTPNSGISKPEWGDGQRWSIGFA